MHLKVHLMRALRRRLVSERGFTLIELLVAMLVGVLVITAAFTILDVSTTASKQVVDRVDATQRGRNGMDQVVQQLRAVACPPVGGESSVVAAGPSSITFYADLDGDEDFNPVQRRIRAVPRASVLDLIGDLNPLSPRTIVDAVDLVAPARPVFAYWVPSADGTTLEALPAAAEVAPVNLPRIARIDIAFATRPTDESRPTVPVHTTVPLQSSVYPRQGRGGQTQTVPTFGC